MTHGNGHVTEGAITAAVSVAVEDSLKAEFGAVHVERIQGASPDRYSTACEVAREGRAALGAFSGTAFLTTGESFPDALAASPISWFAKYPVFLTRKTGLSAETSQTMADIGVSKVYILGSESVIPIGIEDQLQQRFGAANVVRLSGATRYETAGRIADLGESLGMTWDQSGLVRGEDFPDGLAAGPMFGKLGAIMLLTPKDHTDTSVTSRLTLHDAAIYNFHFIGTTAAIGSYVRGRTMLLLQ